MEPHNESSSERDLDAEVQRFGSLQDKLGRGELLNRDSDGLNIVI
jgi:hypothetical protein